MPSKFVKECLDELLPIIEFFVNNVLTTGNYPKLLKESVVPPVLKGKKDLDTELLKSFRPVTQNSFSNKV